MRSISLCLALGLVLCSAALAQTEPPPRERLFAMPAEPAAAGGRPVTLVDEKGQPVPDAAVVFFDTKRERSEKIQRQLLDIAEEFAKDFDAQQMAMFALAGTRFAVDGEGASAIPAV